MIWEGRLHPKLPEKYHFYSGKGQGGSRIGIKGSSSQCFLTMQKCLTMSI